MDSTIDRLMDKQSDLKGALRGALMALQLVKALHEQPASANVPKLASEINRFHATGQGTQTFNVDLDPKAYEQIVGAITTAQEALS